ncbi:hypothetical protein DACRYDRAFT_117977 [Dacryopinax primogenitus]|uniref:Uncharacterized protein n=1 Tax=Dacryopinax primogenitus (strain DJM 731) TaxID=1858805 RepID=M5FQN0_DACPD|nr:uncharacterized protein DACRYDRAFT_117977 [Dacryopinax primogenitus]EJT99210.1 hypothetical protein DACRYDRAFT_117977 [Dacryopinax primogenitus]
MDFPHTDIDFGFPNEPTLSAEEWDDFWKDAIPTNGREDLVPTAMDGPSYPPPPVIVTPSESPVAQGAIQFRNPQTPQIVIPFNTCASTPFTPSHSISPDDLTHSHSIRSSISALPETPSPVSPNDGRGPIITGLDSPFRESRLKGNGKGPELQIARSLTASRRLSNVLGRSRSDSNILAPSTHPSSTVQQWLQESSPVGQPTNGLGISFPETVTPRQFEFFQTGYQAFAGPSRKRRHPDSEAHSPLDLTSPKGNTSPAAEAAIRALHQLSVGFLPVPSGSAPFGYPPLSFAQPQLAGAGPAFEYDPEFEERPRKKRRTARKPTSFRKPKQDESIIYHPDGSMDVTGWFLCPYRWPNDPSYTCRHLAKDANDALRHCLAVHLPQEEALLRQWDARGVASDERHVLPLLEAGGEYFSLYCTYEGCKDRIFHGSRAWESFCTHRDSHGPSGHGLVPRLQRASDEEVLTHTFNQPDKWLPFPSSAIGAGTEAGMWPRRVDARARNVAEKRWKRTVALQVTKVYDSWQGGFEVTRRHAGAEQKLRMVVRREVM